MAKKLKLKHMVKWMKRKSDPTRGFVKKYSRQKTKEFQRGRKKKGGKYSRSGWRRILGLRMDEKFGKWMKNRHNSADWIEHKEGSAKHA